MRNVFFCLGIPSVFFSLNICRTLKKPDLKSMLRVRIYIDSRLKFFYLLLSIDRVSLNLWDFFIKDFY